MICEIIVITSLMHFRYLENGYMSMQQQESLTELSQAVVRNHECAHTPIQSQRLTMLLGVSPTRKIRDRNKDSGAMLKKALKHATSSPL